MKKTKIIVPALAMLVMSTAATVTGTVAWFSMNKTVSASGMMVKANAEGSLVITKGALPTTATRSTNASFLEEGSVDIYASTHDSDYSEYSTGLKKISNADQINSETGIKLNNKTGQGNELVYEIAQNTGIEGARKYYVDYTVYIAGDGDAFAAHDLIVKISSANDFLETKSINKAVSIDFYGSPMSAANDVNVSLDNYKGTLNLAGKKNNADGCTTTPLTSFEIENIDIPEAVSGGTASYGITMRIYYDGALLESAGTKAFTTYKQCSAGEKAAANTYYYTEGDGTGIIPVVAGTTDVSGKWKVDTSNTTKAYARTTEVLNLENVTIGATFEAKVHD